MWWTDRLGVASGPLSPTKGILMYGSMTLALEGWAAALVVMAVWARVLERRIERGR